jgi:ornithine cyclodeaminase/alanine dehydrogenase
MPILLRDPEIRQCLSMLDAIEAIEEVCLELAAETAIAPPRLQVELQNRHFMRILPAAMFGAGVMGFKQFHTGPWGAFYTYSLFSQKTGESLAIMDASYITGIRTGAAAGVALKHMTSEKAETLGVIGSGFEAGTEVLAVAAVRPSVKRAKVYSRSADNRNAFATDLTARTGIEIRPVETPQDAIDDVEILVAATAGSVETVQGDWLPGGKGLHFNSIGSTAFNQRELSPSAFAWPDRIVIDTIHLLDESGDAIAAKDAGTLDESKIVLLHDVVAGKAVGRAGPGESTLYKSVGAGIQDLAVAYRIYQNAHDRGLGTHIDEYFAHKHI